MADGMIRSRGTMETTGWLQFLEGERRSTLQTIARFAENGTLLPQRLRAVYRKPDRTREITIAYDDQGVIAALNLVTNGAPRMSDVPEPLWAETVDPLTGLLQLQLWLTRRRHEGAAGRTRCRVFDGRTRSDFELSFDGQHAALVIRGLIGFDEDDLIVTLPEDDAPRILDIALADRSLATPERVEGDNTVLELTGLADSD